MCNSNYSSLFQSGSVSRDFSKEEVDYDTMVRDHKNAVAQLDEVGPDPTILLRPRRFEKDEFTVFWPEYPIWRFRCLCCCKIFPTNDELSEHR